MTSRTLPARTAQTNPFLRALLIIALVSFAAALILALTGFQRPEDYEFNAADAAVRLSVSGILAGVGGTVMLVWLHAAAVTWKHTS